jgi:DmsE family decaheme c-type cytochrome
MNIRHPLFAALLLGAGLVFSVAVSAEEPIVETPAPPAGNLASQYSEKGADTCIKCHDADEEYPVFDIFKTKHGQKGDKRSPFAGLQCEACHGPGAAGEAAMEEAFARGGHVGKVPPGQKRPPILNFGEKSDETVEKQNSMCLTCHERNDHIGWKGSVHAAGSVACANCHTIHTPNDPVLATATQPDVCYKCHLKQRADFHKPSVHPVRFGQMACSECHSPHGSNTTALLTKPTVNQACYTCHAEKRGPFLWEHAPVAEDCTLCHTPHGSVYPALLKKSPPLLCQQCHAPAGHPSIARTADALPGGSAGPSGFLLAGSCANCHSQVHGSNHPSGVKLMR